MFFFFFVFLRIIQFKVGSWKLKVGTIHSRLLQEIQTLVPNRKIEADQKTSPTYILSSFFLSLYFLLLLGFQLRRKKKQALENFLYKFLCNSLKKSLRFCACCFHGRPFREKPFSRRTRRRSQSLLCESFFLTTYCLCTHSSAPIYLL